MPYLKEDRPYTDPVATDLVGALLSVRKFNRFSRLNFTNPLIKLNIIIKQSPRKPWESRRSSVESARLSTFRNVAQTPNSSRMQIKGFRGPQVIAEILDKCLDWNFDIFRLEVLTEKRYKNVTQLNNYHVFPLFS